MLRQSGARLRVAFLAAALLVFVVPSIASALIMNPDPQTFTNGTITGDIDFIMDVAGLPAGGVNLHLSGSQVITLVFQLGNVTGGAVESIGVGITGLIITRAGWIANSSDSLVDIASVNGSSSTAVFWFTGTAEAGGGTELNPNVGAGETSNLFYVSFASLAPPKTINFMINPLVGADFSVSASIVPEPASLLLLGAGLAGLAIRARKAQKH